MVKTILKILGGIVAFIFVLIIAASIAIMFIVNKGMIEEQMKKALNRHVQIEDISVGIFSIVSGIEVNKVTISNFKTENQLKALEGKPVPAGDVFVRMESLRLKLKFLPLLKKQFMLKELVLYAPTVNISRSKAGVFNFDDLTRPKKLTKEEQAELEKEKAEEAKEPKKPFTADDIPVALSIGKLGIKDGTVNYYDGGLNQKFQIYKLTAMLYSIVIDPKDLEKKDSAKLKIYMGVKNIGPVRSGSVDSFDVTFDVSGTVKPFDLKTRRLEPEVSVHAGSPEGMVTGLQIFNSIAGNNVLSKYIGNQLDFLKGKQTWEGSKMAYVDVWWKAGVAKLSNGNLKLKECRLLFGGIFNTNSKGLNVDLELELLESRNNAIKVGIRRQVESGLKQLGAKKYVDPNKIAETAMQPLLNKNGMVYMKFKIAGTTAKPAAKLTHPALGSIGDIIKKVAGNVILEAGKEAAGKALKDGGKSLMKGLKKLF
ncbi:MAG TPA: AsmA family protein [Spirochaetota bacterium]|nr:AsmA family protein [Spirochaetota bacterium]HOD15080.1 AsmA family protein [Spirochaetota bacterium]HPG50336.1 AsmA family protein [Spirochaetota bacterium]HPN10557.1 AsmA family protein [Spirochaetota bacterium]